MMTRFRSESGTNFLERFKKLASRGLSFFGAIEFADVFPDGLGLLRALRRMAVPDDEKKTRSGSK
jgi:hypothetical protein